MTILEPVYVFYLMVALLVVAYAIWLYAWWRDIVITTLAMKIACTRLEELGIALDSSPHELLQELERYAYPLPAHGQEGPHQLILASLYLLRFDLGLTRNFFQVVAGMPGFESGQRLLDARTQCHKLREFMLKSGSASALAKTQDKVEQAAERLSENLSEAEKIQPVRIAA